MRDPYFDSVVVQHLFDSSGHWTAFRADRHVFDTVGNCVGWLPFDESEVHSRHGLYLGHIYPGNRFYRYIHFIRRESIERPPKVPFVRGQLHPGNLHPERLPLGCNDIRLSSHV